MRKDETHFGVAEITVLVAVSIGIILGALYVWRHITDQRSSERAVDPSYLGGG